MCSRMCLVSSVLDNLLLRLSNTSAQGTFSNNAFKTESSMWMWIPPLPSLPNSASANRFKCSSKKLRLPLPYFYPSGGAQQLSLKGVKTEWVQVWSNSIRFAIYTVKSKQTYQTFKTITMMWWFEVRYALQFVPVNCNLLSLCIYPL